MKEQAGPITGEVLNYQSPTDRKPIDMKEILTDPSAHFVRDASEVRILNDFFGKSVSRPNDNVHVHDQREKKLNKQFADEIDICRKKIHNERRPSTGYMEEAVCFAKDVYFEIKTARVKNKFLFVSAGSDRIKEAYDPNGKFYGVRKRALNNPEHVPGRNIVFMGVGRASNYYHWMGEQMPRLALFRKYEDLSKIDNIVVFVRHPVSFIEDSIRWLFPEFKGQVRQVNRHSATSDEAFFFVSNGLASRTKDQERKFVPQFRPSWGSVLDFLNYLDARRDGLVMPWYNAANTIVVSREKAPLRRWHDEDDFVARVAGAKKLVAEDLSLPEQISAFQHADTVVAQHGAGLANILFCRPGTRVIEITARSHARRAWDFAKLGIARGLEYHVVVIDADLDDPYVDIEEPVERIPSLYASDLRASKDAMAFLLGLATAPPAARQA